MRTNLVAISGWLAFVASCGQPPAQTYPPPPPPPSPSPAPTSDLPPPPDASPSPPARRDPREIGFATMLRAYKSNGRDVYEDGSASDNQTVKTCFEHAVPLEQRRPSVYYVHVYIPNADHDAASGGGGFGLDTDAASGIMYPEPGKYRAFEDCVRAAFPTQHAPSDVVRVELRLHVYTVAQAKGELGHGRVVRP